MVGGSNRREQHEQATEKIEEPAARRSGGYLGERN